MAVRSMIVSITQYVIQKSDNANYYECIFFFFFKLLHAMSC